MAKKTYYASKASGTTSSDKLTFFNVNRIDDGENVTNLDADAQVLKEFNVKKMIVYVAGDITAADAVKLTEKSIVKLTVGTNEMLIIPLQMAFSAAEYKLSSNGGLTSGNTDVLSLNNPSDGYTIENEVKIPANTTFKVETYTSAEFATDTNIMIALVGETTE